MNEVASERASKGELNKLLTGYIEGDLTLQVLRQIVGEGQIKPT